jgi:hypothetical protein
MKREFDIALLSVDQKDKIKQLESELGVVLIAWEQHDESIMDRDHYQENYYQLYEGDRL